MRLHIGISGPIAKEHVIEYLEGNLDRLPKGYPGAPLTGILIGELLKLGHKVSAFTTDPALYAQSGLITASGANFDFTICPARPRAWLFNKNRLGRVIDGFSYERENLLSAINNAKPDIIHAHWTYEFALAALKSGLPHLITCHDSPVVVMRYTRSPYRALRYLMARQVFQKGYHFSAVSPYMAGEVQHYIKEPIDVVPNPLADYVLTNGSIRKLPETKRIGLICNGLDARKNPKPSLQAFALLKSNHPSAELHLFGSGFGSGEDAQYWCHQQGIEVGMIFHGSVTHRQLTEHLNNLDLLLHPALEESFGVVIAEAMALGLPIVAGKRSGAVPWVVGIDESSESRCCAILTDVSNSAAIALALEEAFDQHYPERSASGYHRSRHLFAPDAIAESYMKLYKKIIQPKT